MKRRLAPSEYAEQCAVVSWWDHVCKLYGFPSFALMAIPNGAMLAGDARLRAIRMAMLKKSGLRPGAPDLFLAVPRLDYGGLFIEMKVGRNKPSDEQHQIIQYLRAQYVVKVCYGAEEAIGAIKQHMGIGK